MKQKFNKEPWLLIITFVLVALAVVMTSCSTAPSVVVSPPKVYPIVGWNEDYDTAIKSEVTNNMLIQPNKVMTKFCAEWPELSIEQRKQMYADLLYSIALPESDYDRSTLYYEDTLGTDSKTQLPVVSEGFLQLSYGDVNLYPACKFDATKDKQMIQDDWSNRNGKHSWKSNHASGKTILDSFNNLLCGVHIIDELLSSKPTTEFGDNLGRYWSSMRRSGNAYSDIWAQMRKRNSPCH